MGVAVRRYRDILIIIITFPYSTCITVGALIMRLSNSASKFNFKKQ